MNQAFHRIALCGVLAGALIGGGLIASAQQATTTKKKPSSTKKPAPKTATGKTGTAKKNTGKKTVSSSTSKGKKTAASKKSSMPKQSWRSRQLSPEPQRYQEIQSALAQKGYFKGNPNGVWDGESQAALRKFQEDQNLEPTGKLDSLSLIALGLGPKRESGAVKPQQPAAIPAPPPQ